MLPYKNENPTALDSIAGIPIYTSKFVEKGKVYITSTHLITDSIDTILMPVLLAEVRREATRIVLTKTRKRFPWLKL
jgi:hypothetical protein